MDEQQKVPGTPESDSETKVPQQADVKQQEAARDALDERLGDQRAKGAAARQESK